MTGAASKKGGSAMRRMQLSLLVFICTAFSAMTAVAAPEIHRAKLSGAQEVPKVKSPGKGSFKLNVSKDGAVVFELNVKGLTSPTAASIHRGRKGENGPPVAGLFGGPTKMGPFKGILAQGMITEESLLGELEGKTVGDLVGLIRSGETYVNVLTETYPAGEIRGQIK